MPDFAELIEERVPGTLRRAGDEVRLVPPSASAVAEILSLANETRTPLCVPGAENRGRRPTLLLDRLSALVAVDEESRIVHAQGGMTLGDLEAAADSRGWTLGVPAPFRNEPVGAWLAKGAPGRWDKEDDPVRQLAAGMELILPDGRTLNVRPAPRRAVGPDLIRAAIGARGRLGVIVSVHVVARARRARTAYVYNFLDGATASRALHRIRGAGVRPIHARSDGTMLRLVLEMEGARGEAAARVVRRITSELEGLPMDAVDPEVAPTPPVAESAEILGRLSSVLDPNGIMQA